MGVEGVWFQRSHGMETGLNTAYQGSCCADSITATSYCDVAHWIPHRDVASHCAAHIQYYKPEWPFTRLQIDS